MKYLGTLSYCGTAYSGFQRQRNGKATIQGEVEKQLSFLLGRGVSIRGAGRTDAGVHAYGQRFTFEAEALKLPQLIKTLNRLLPIDIRLLDLVPVDQKFDVRRNATGKKYQYVFYVEHFDPLMVGKAAFLRRDDFKFDPFLRTLSQFIGKHCFQNFTTKPEDEGGFYRHITRFDAVYEREKDRVVCHVEGSGFMRYQIRMMIGAAIRVGLGRLTEDAVATALNGGPRHVLPYKAAPEGLYLMEVIYDEKAEL